jgi:hypothetical protein
MLRLRPPCYLLLRGRPLEVISRELHQHAGKTVVVYECHGRAGPGRLIVTLADPFLDVTLEWRADGAVVRLSQEDVEVFSR